MGTTCANLHIFAKDTAERAEPWLTSACDRLDFVPADSANADLRIAIGFTENWLTIQNEGLAGILSETDLKLAAEISRETKSPVLVTALYDSDEFAFLLFENGKQVDGYSTDAGIVPMKIRSSAAKKRPGLWSRVFAQDISMDRLEALFVSTGAFADEHLDRLSEIVMLPHAQSRFRYDDHDPAVNFLQLCTFRRRPSEPSVRQTGGVTDFKMETSPREMYVGELSAVAFELSAEVSMLDNPVFEVIGSGVDGEIAAITKVNGFWHCGPQHMTRGGICRFDAKLARSDKAAVRAVVDALSPSSLQEAPQPTITVLYSVWLQAVQAGHGELQCIFYPRTAAGDAIALKPRLQLQVRTPAWTPLRSAIGAPLRQLNDPQILSAVIVVPVRESILADAETKIEHWLRHAAGNAEVSIETTYEGQMVGENFRVPRRRKKLQLDDLGKKKWQQLFANQSTLQSLSFEVKDGVCEEPIAGASIQQPCESVDQGAATFHLGFWQRNGDSQEDSEMLSHLVDEVFCEFSGLQAWQSTWNWIPKFTVAEGNHYTPYEEAKGIGNPSAEHQLGEGYMQEAWCGRYLRGFGERLWLGAELCKRIDLGLLGGTAKSTDRGVGVRLELERNASLTDLEAALEVITPPPNPLPY
jgi:hypothetical protein